MGKLVKMRYRYLLTGIISISSAVAFAQDYSDAMPTKTSSGAPITITKKNIEALPVTVELKENRDPKSMTWSAAFDEIFDVAQSMQNFNNASIEASGSTDNGGLLGGTAILGKVQSIKNITNQLSNLKSNRIVHTALKLSKNDKIVRGTKGMLQRKNKLHLIYYQFGVLILLGLIKNWQLSRLEKGEFRKRCLIELQSTVFIFVGLAIAAPLVFYGYDYANVLKGLVEVIRSA